jgi:GAF domain-containing protein/HAMP domain-containing protein
MKVTQAFGFKAKAQEVDRRSKPTGKWRIAHKLTIASVLMIVLTLLAGGAGLWQVRVIGQAIRDTREKEQLLVHSLELLAAEHRLIATLDHMLLAEDRILVATDVATSWGTLSFHAETLLESGGAAVASDLLDQIRKAYSELLEAMNEVDSQARQENWREAGIALDQKLRPTDERMGLLIRRLVSQADRDVEAMASHAQRVVRQATLMLVVLVVSTTAIALGWRQFVFRGLSLSISELRQGVARISSGDLEYELDIRTGDEIEELGDEFNKMAGELADLIGSLEERVADRTRGLQAAAEVSRAITSVLDPDELLRQVVDLARERFDLYYVGLFLLDEEHRFAVLRAGTGEAGQKMLAQGHRLEVGGDSMIGQCVARAEARIALDVGEEPVRFDNPLLPETRSELALPLRSRGRVIGAMTVQSAEEAAFDEADIAVLQTMADQVAVAIDNARLFAEAQAALAEMETVHRRYLGQAWAEYLQTATETRYETERPGIAPLGDAVLPEIWQAVKRQGVTVLTGNGGEGKTSHSSLVTPIALRGEVIGALGVRDDYGERQWSDDEIALIEAVAERMALAAENLRLFDETQRRAAHEWLIREITDKMRRAVDMDDLMQIAVQEMAAVLNASSTFVQLSVPSDLEEHDEGEDGKQPPAEEE